MSLNHFLMHSSQKKSFLVPMSTLKTVQSGSGSRRFWFRTVPVQTVPVNRLSVRFTAILIRGPRPQLEFIVDSLTVANILNLEADCTNAFYQPVDLFASGWDSRKARHVSRRQARVIFLPEQLLERRDVICKHGCYFSGALHLIGRVPSVELFEIFLSKENLYSVRDWTPIKMRSACNEDK